MNNQSKDSLAHDLFFALTNGEDYSKIIEQAEKENIFEEKKLAAIKTTAENLSQMPKGQKRDAELRNFRVSLFCS